ncbi:MAG: hypothetical protein WCK98_02320 [bacterium]
MFWGSQLNNEEYASSYQKLSLVDILLVKTLLNFNRLVALAMGFLALSLVNIPLIKATGWVGYTIVTLQILYVHLRFKKWLFVGFIGLSLILNVIYFWSVLS